MKVYEFNAAQDKPLINLAYANGFLPQTYARALQPLFDDYRVVSVQARPMWDNCPPDSLKSWAILRDDLLAALDALTDRPVIGIGHSLGSITTMVAAVQHPERFSHLVLIDPTLLRPRMLWVIRIMRLLRQGNRFPPVQVALHRRRTWENTEAAFAYFRGKPLFVRWSDDAVRTYTESITAPNGEGSVSLVYSPEWEAQIYKTVATDVWRWPGRITQPVLVIRGEHTDVFTEACARNFLRLNPRVRIVTVAGAGHLVPQEQPEQVGKLIKAFLGESAAP
jgi:pimeloyl-ACP methyl ester carboxylesterase